MLREKKYVFKRNWTIKTPTYRSVHSQTVIDTEADPMGDPWSSHALVNS